MADIGEKLRSAREAKGLSIADIEKATKIQGRYLTAIEQNDFDKLPGEFYARAFIRQYAQIVGLDGKELLSDFHKEVPESKPEEYVENSIDNKSEEVRETTHNKKGLWKSYLPKIAIGLGVVIVLLIAYVVYARLFSGNGNNNNQNAGVTVSKQSGSKKKAPQNPVKTSSVKVKRLGNGQFKVTGLKENRNLVVRAGNQSTTASVTIDGSNSWSQTLAPKQKRTVAIPKGAHQVVVNLSNDEGSKVTIGGKKVPYTVTGSNHTIALIVGKKKTAKSSTSSSSNSNSNGNTNSTGSNNNQTNVGGQTANNSRKSRKSSNSSSQQNQNSNTNTGNSGSANTGKQNQNSNQ